MADTTITNANNLVTKGNLAAFSKKVAATVKTKLDKDSVISSGQTPDPTDANVYSAAASDARYVQSQSGKGLSTNDYTTTEKNKLAGIAEGANKTVVDAALSDTSANPVANKAVNAALAGKLDSASVIGSTDTTTAAGEGNVYSAKAVDGKISTAVADASTSLGNQIGGKQDKLTAGDGIKIVGSTISCTLDTTLYKVVEALPTAGQETNKIYLVASASKGDQNNYTEYVWTGSAWEKLGEYAATVDLSAYAKSADVVAKNDKIIYEPCTDAEIEQVWTDAVTAA